MTYNELKKLIKVNNFQEYIYVSNLFTRRYEIVCNTSISIYRNGLRSYIVTKWRDYDYGRYSERKIFSDKDLAADYAWKLFGGDEEFKKALDKIYKQLLL